MKTIHVKYLVLTTAIALLSFAMLNETGFLEKLKELVKEYNTKLPDERLYLHFDKPIYKPGEDIWFCAYLVSGPENKPSAVSTVIYVELISPKGTIVKNVVISAKNGIAKGDFNLSTSDEGGLYKVKAYTQWMKNFGENYFMKDLPVQKYVAPRLLMKIDFERETFGPGELVKADFDIRDLDNQPVVYQTIYATVNLSGKEYKKFSFETNVQGKGVVEFVLPEKLDDNDGILNLSANYKGKTESVMRAVPIILNNISLNFFPEGGTFIENVTSKIAFKALNEFGKPADISGSVFTEHGDSITSFKSFHDGMGAFLFKPLKDVNYYAVISEPGGITQKYELPKISADEFVMNVTTEEDENIKVKIFSKNKCTGYIVLQMTGQEYYSNEVELLSGWTNYTVKCGKFPAGIARVTFFDDNYMPVCERLVFINKQKILNIEIKTDKTKYAPRDLTEIEIYTSDANHKPVSASLSLAVTTDKIITMADDRQDNILSALLLSSEVKGKIYEPSFYFKENEPDAAEGLDYLLMTQGWRRFAWTDVIEKNYEYKFFPEREDVISGKVVNHKTNEGVKSRIYVVEWGGSRRTIDFLTDEDGNFVITNVDPLSNLTLYAHAPGKRSTDLKIVLPDEKNGRPTDSFYDIKRKNTIIIPDILTPNVEEKNEEMKVENNNQVKRGSLNFSLTEDVQALEEVVVIGYGTQRKSDLTGSVISIKTEEISFIQGIENSLQGRASGVVVLSNSNDNGGSNDIKIRGISGIQGSSPLYIIDGVPYDGLNSGTLSQVPVIQSEEIENIDIIKGAAASAIYGSRGSNGVVVITTKKDVPYRNFYNKAHYFTTRYIPASKNSTRSREFYCPVYTESIWPEKRTDFRETILWKTAVTTSSDGKAKVTYYNSDEITTFRVIAEGMSQQGLIGRKEYTYSIQKPVSVETKIPSFVSTIDTVNLNVMVSNNLDREITDKIEVFTGKEIDLIALSDSFITLKPNEVKNIKISLKPLYETQNAYINIKFGQGKYRDEVSHKLEIFKTGFPYETSLSGEGGSKSFLFDCSDAVDGSIKCKFTAYPSAIDNLLSGIESVIREPYGCFEQTSASTYPNILILEYLRASGKTNPTIENKALRYIEQGYKRLVGFETSEGGFEWFGHVPPHEGLTAYGLLEFTEMQRVFSGVSDKLIERTKKWLLDRRDGKGGFNSKNGKYGFSGAGEKVTNAYLVYALSETGVPYEELKREYEKALEESESSGDSYRMALLANAAINFMQKNDAVRLLQKLNACVYKMENLKIGNTLVNSYGKSAQIETLSLILLAILKSENIDYGAVFKITDYFLGQRSYGGFGSTQATILALKGLTLLELKLKDQSNEGNFVIGINDKVVIQKSFFNGQDENIVMNDIEKYLVKAKNKIKIEFDTTKAKIPYSFDLSWKILTPMSDENCRVDLITRVEKNKLKEAESLRLVATLTNKTDKGLPMTVALIGIPGGLTPQHWQLKKLQEEKVCDYYEIHKNYIVLYFTEMGPSETKTIKLDLKADVPGIYKAPAGTAYLYYSNKEKVWIDGEKVEIE